MDDLWMRNDRPIPASYWLAAGIGSLVVFTCYLTAWWVPWFVRDYASTILSSGAYGIPTILMVVFSGSLGLLAGSAPLLALRWPGLAIAISLLPVASSVTGGSTLHFGVIAGLGSVVLSAGWRDFRMALLAAGSAAAVIAAWVMAEGRMAAPFRAEIDLSYTSRATTMLLYLIALSLVLLGAWALRVVSLREIERKALAARSDQVEEQAAVVGERARLARDLHDVVAHHVSLIAVRAETAPYTHPQIDAQARGVLTDIAADARLALDELRGVLGILGRSGTAERAPQPTWSDISALVERTRSAGVGIDLVGDVTAEVGPSSGYAAYRLVQEALTNARKHAPGKVVTLDLEATSQLLTVLVSTPLGTTAGTSGAGQGLVGMRERVEALGGRLLAGPVGEDFVVEAILPRATT